MHRRVLIISSYDKGKELLVELLTAYDFVYITSVKRGDEARRVLNEKIFELVIINAPLADEFGDELALMAAEISSSGVILIVKSEIMDDIAVKVEDCGVLVLPKPISRQLFFQALKLAAATQRRLMGLKDENTKLQKRIEEIRLVDRAKCALIQYLNFTEPQAHRYIEKQAMDRRVSKREIAEGILNTYEC